MLAGLLLSGCADNENTDLSTVASDSAVPPPALVVPPPLPVEPTVAPADDYHSYANPGEIAVRHISLDLQTDFGEQILKGTATLTVERVSRDAEMLMLDTRDLEIQDVRVESPAGKWVQTYYKLGNSDGALGAPLAIELPPGDASTFSVRIRYRTAPGASGLQWLTPAQTAGKKHPFLFSQSQAIHARSWIPLQDSPAVRVTYDATIRTPQDLLAVMSASNDADTERDGEYTFRMPQPIPSYLIAIAVGDLVFEPIGERTGVYAEPALVKAAADEFADTETMLEITEDLFGPYRWGRYDLLILPPSFPFGGMENPRLSFITPTVIAGDRSLVSLIAHELAHSWSGNLITNATWRDLWLNEGFTSYLEARIMEAVYGAERAEMENTLGYQGLARELAELPPEAQILAIDLRGQDPDNVFTSVPYTKGQLFLTWLEGYFGREEFDVFLRNYFDRFAFESITTDQFLEYLSAQLPANRPAKPQIMEWVFEPGLPADAVLPQSDAFTRIDATRNDWLEGEIAATDIDTEAWTVHEWLAFLNNMPDQLSNDQLVALDQAFDLTESANNEIAHSWLKIAIRNDYEPAFARLENYLLSIGRLKLIRPLYQELVKTERGKQFAQRVYAQARPGYHPLAQRVSDAIVMGDGG
ncbi:MAG: M1 family metallopeptidase [Gammaproteobacteria bacterium]|nr:M1 family metallopeptidase [Gammaproteobacteria bacterium]NND59721.1 M1 family metallopeptidase [Gammaproteobacteria bacterium]